MVKALAEFKSFTCGGRKSHVYWWILGFFFFFMAAVSGYFFWDEAAMEEKIEYILTWENLLLWYISNDPTEFLMRINQ